MFNNTQHREEKGHAPLWCALAFLLISACSTPQITTETDAKPILIKRIVILPFIDVSAQHGKNVTIRCPLCGKVFTTGTVADNADEMLTTHLTSVFSNIAGLESIPPSQAQGALSSLLSNNNEEPPELDLLVAIGRNLNADAVIVGRVYRFKDRIGTNYFIESPASVAFDIDLIDVVDKKLIWSGHFDETQQTLSENLLKLSIFLKRKGQWVTAESMAISGLNKVLETFPLKKP